MSTIEIWTDGACKAYNMKTGGYGGWAYSHIQKTLLDVQAGESWAYTTLRQESGSEEGTTSNRMELTAILKGLLALGRTDMEQEVIVYSDSAYAVNAFNLNWIERWEKNNWRTRLGKVVSKDLWVPLIYIVKQFPNIKFVHVKGHNGNKYNEEVDKLAQDAAFSLQLEKQPDYFEVKRVYNRNRARRKGPMLVDKSMYRQKD